MINISIAITQSSPRVVVGGIQKEYCTPHAWQNSLKRCYGSSSQNVSHLITCEMKPHLFFLFFLPLLPVEIMFFLHQNLEYPYTNQEPQVSGFPAQLLKIEHRANAA